MEENLFVRIENSVNTRRLVFETNRDMIICFKRFEKFREIRKLKIEAIDALLHIFKEIEELSKALQIDIPNFNKDLHMPSSFSKKVEIPLKQSVTPEALPVKEEVKAPAEAPPAEDDEIDELERSIAEIEKKIKELA